MGKQTNLSSLDKAIAALVDRRQRLVADVAEIDAIFTKYGIKPSGLAQPKALRPGRLPAPAPKRRRTRGRFAETAEQFVIGLLKEKPRTGSDINAAWADAGRKGKADNALSLLVKKKELRRTPVRDGRGSTYSLA